MLSPFITTSSDIQDSIDSLAATTPFSFDLDVTIDGVTATHTVGFTLQDIIDAGGNRLDALVSLINGAIASIDAISGQIAAVIDDAGRLAFQVVSSEIESLIVEANTAADILAGTLLGYATDAANELGQRVDDVASVLTALGDLQYSFSNVDITLDGADGFLFDFEFDVARQTEFAFDFGDDADANGLSFDAEGKLLVGAGFGFNASIAMDTVSSSFTATVSELGAGIEIDDSSTVTVDAEIGVVSGTATGTVSLDAALLADFAGGATITESSSAATLVANFNLASSGFNYNFGNDTFSFTGAANYLVDLTLTVGANLIKIGGVTATADIDVSGNPFSGDSPTIIFNADFDSFFDFNNITPAGIVNSIAEFIGWIDSATGSSLLSDIEIPFVSGGLDDLANLGQVLSNALIFDFGGDNARDGADKLITDVNAALQAAGLDAFLRATPGALPGEIDVELLDGVDDVDISGSIGGGISNGSGLSGFSITGLDLTGILLGALGATITVNLSSSQTIEKEFSLSIDETLDNVGLGDDVAKLLDAFNSPTFESVQDFLARIDEIGVLGDTISLVDLSNFYDPVEDQVTYTIEIVDAPIFDVELAADFELDLGALLNVQSDTRLVLSGLGSVELVLGVDLTSNPLAGELPGVSGDLEGATLLTDIGVVPKLQPAVTGTGSPTAVQGILSQDAGFTIDIDGTEFAVVVASVDTADNTTAAQLATDIDNALNTAQNAAGLTVADDQVSVTESGGRLVFTGGGNVSDITITVASGDPALGAFGLQPTQSSTGGASLTAAVLLPTLIGVFTSDVPFQLAFTDSVFPGNDITYDVEVAATDTLNVVGGKVQNVNRNIIDLVADIQTALETATEDGVVDPPEFDLNNFIEVGFQGNFLVLTLKDADLSDTPVTFDGFSTTAAGDLGFGAQTANTDDLLIRLDNSTVFEIDLSNATDIAAVLTAISGADPNLDAVITPDDPATPENEGGKSLTISYDFSSDLLLAIEATNGSAAASQLGIVGLDVSPFSAGETPDGSITGNPIGGVELADRFFIAAPSAGSLETIASFEFDAQAGRLITDLQLVGANDVAFSSSVDLRDFVDTEIELKNVNGFTAGTFKLSNNIVDIDVDGDGTDDAQGVQIVTTGGASTGGVGDVGLADGLMIIETGVQASAALGFIEVELTGTADFQAEASIGLNTGNAVISDEVVTLGEVIDLFEAGDILDLFRLPSITVPFGDSDFGGVDLTLSIGSGSAGFDAIIEDILPGNSASITIDILALGDPFMKTRFDQAGGFVVNDADSFTVNDNTVLAGLLIDGARLRFTNTNGDVFDGKIDMVTDLGATLRVDLVELTTVAGSDTPALDVPGTALSDFTDIVLLPSANVTLPDIGAIFEDPLSDFGLDDILNALELLVDFLLEFQEFDFLQQPIPILDKSVAELLGMAQDLADYIDELRANPAGSLQFLEDAINDAIGISSATLIDIFGTVNDGDLSGVPSAPFQIGWDNAEEMLTLTLNIGAGFSEALNVGFSDMGFGDIFGDIGIDGLLNFSGSAGLEASGGIFLTLGIGIDLDQLGANPLAFDDAIFLLEDSNLEAVLSVGGTDLAFSAGLGPFALALQNSDVDDAEINISVSAEVSTKTGSTLDMAGRVSIGDIIDGTTAISTLFEIDGANGASSFGTIAGTLPVFFPSDANLIGTIRIGEEAGSGAPNSGLGDLFNFDNLTFTTDAAALIAAEDTLADGLPNNDALVVDISELVSFFTDFDFSSFSLFDSIRLAVDGFDGFLQLLETTIFGALGDLDIPLVGSSFSDAAQFIADFRVDFVGPLREAIDAVEDAADDFTDPDKNIISKLLFDLLGPFGLNLLLPLDGTLDAGDDSPEDFIGLDSAALAGVIFDGDPLEQADIAWDFAIGQSTSPLDNVGFGFDIGIPGLGLRSEAEITATLGWELQLGFGLSTQDGFYLDVFNDGGLPELVFEVEVTPVGEITGELAFLVLTATTATRDIDGVAGDESTGLSASFSVDLIDDNDSNDTTKDLADPDSDINRIGLTEFGDLGLLFNADVTAAAVLDVSLGLNPSLVGSSVATGFPSIVAEFDFLWGFDLDFSLTEAPDFGSVLADSLQILAFNNVGLDLGEFITEVLGLIVDAVAEFTEPLQPFIDFLTAPIPIIDVFGVNLTMLDLAAAFGDFDAGLIENLAELITLINTVAELRAAGDLSIVIPLGSFVLVGGGEDDNPFEDGFDSSDTFNSRANSGDFDGLADAVDTFLDNPGGSDDDKKAGKTVQKLKKPGGAFAFPILEDPSQVFGLLMGNQATLVTYDLEPLIVNFEKNFFFSIFGPLGISLGLIIEFEADFAFGYDTQGIFDFVGNDFRNPLQLLNGFFISDTENPDGSGADVPELRFLGGITAAVELNLGIARAGVAGGLFIEILFDLFDPDGDGKVRIAELISNVENQLRAPGAGPALAPLAIFDVTGEIFARLFAFLKIDFGFFDIDLEFDIVDPITLLEFEIDFFRPPVVASETYDGDLIINVGPFAPLRLLGNATDFDETVTVRKKSDNGGTITVEVFTTSSTGFGSDSPTASNPFEYEIDSGGTLIIDGGDGDDHIILDGWRGDEVVFEIDGGLGDDVIEFVNSVAGNYNSPFNVINGGAGADSITGSNGRDFIVGGAGDDTIDAAGGQDLVIADQANVLTTSIVADPLGNDGNDVVTGGDESDIIIGGGGSDDLEGNDGADIILGDGGQINFDETLDGTNYLVTLVGGLHAGGISGTDDLGVGEADTIDAGAGNDIVFASGGNDDIIGGGGQTPCLPGPDSIPSTAARARI